MMPFQKLRELLEKSTPGPVETRCREFSNHAPLELWTNFGWIDQQPRNYREPTYEFFAEAHNTLPKVLEALDFAIEAMEVGAFHHSSCGANWYEDNGKDARPCTCAHYKIDLALAKIKSLSDQT